MAGGRQSRQGGGAGGGKVGQGGASLPRAWAKANDCGVVGIQGSCNVPFIFKVNNFGGDSGKQSCFLREGI